MKKLFLLITFICGMGVTVGAQSKVPALNLKFGKPSMDEMKMTDYADDPEADAVVLMKTCDVKYSVTKAFNVTQKYEVKVRIKVLNEKGKRFGDLSIPYVDCKNYQDIKEQFYDFQATAYNLDERGKIVGTKINSTMIFDERVDNDYMVRKVSIPQVRKGTVIEYKYTLFSTYFWHIYDYVLQDEIPVLYVDYEMTIPALLQFNVDAPVKNSSFECNVKYGSVNIEDADPMTDKTTMAANCYSIKGKNLKGVHADDYIWCPKDYYAKVVSDLSATNFPGGYQPKRDTWEKIDDIILSQDEISSRLNDKSKISEQIQSTGLAGIADDKSRILAAINLLNQNVSWNGEYNILPNSFNSVLKKKSGSSADLNMMLINILNEVGLKAYPVLLSTRHHGMLPIHPSLKCFDTFIVAVDIQGGRCYVDACNPYGNINVLRPNLYATQARLLKKGNSEWVDLTKFANSRKFIMVESAIDNAGKMIGKISNRYTGNAVDELRHEYHEAADSVAFIQSIQNKNGINVKSVQIKGVENSEKEATMVLDFEKDIDSNGDHIYVSPFVFKPMEKSPFKSETRELPVELPYRMNDNYIVSMQIPEGYEVEELPNDFEITTPDRNIVAHMVCSKDDKSVRVNFVLSIKELLYVPEKYTAIKSVYDQTSQRVNNMIVFKKK